MKDLEFKNLKCSVSVTCFSENGEIEDLADIESDFENALNDVLADIVSERNSVLAFDISEIVVEDNGVDKGK